MNPENMEHAIVNDDFEKLLLIGEDSSVNSLQADLLSRVVAHLAADMQSLRISTTIRGFNLLIKVCTEAPEKLISNFDNLCAAISNAIVSGDKLCGYSLALLQALLSSSVGREAILERKQDFLAKLIQSVSLPSLNDCHIKAIECIWQIRKSSSPLVPEEVLEVVNMLYTYMISESGDNKFKLLNFLMEIIQLARHIVTGETISESWVSFLVNTVEEDDGIGNVRSLRILLTITSNEKYILKRPNSARNMLFLLKQSLMRFKNKLDNLKYSKRAQCLGDLYSLFASSPPIICDYATQDDIQLHQSLLEILQTGHSKEIIPAAGILWNICEDGDEAVVQRLMDAHAHLIAYDVLRKYATETDKKREIHSSLLTMLLHMSRFSSARKELLKADKIVEYLMMVIEKGYSVYGSDAVRAVILLVFLLGTEEADSILRSGKYMVTAEHVQRLITILQTTLRGEHGEHHRLGYFPISLLMHACLALSQSDSNKIFLIRSHAIVPLTRVLQMFQDTLPQIPLSGGGGDDVQSCTLAVEALMHLSFHFQHSNEELFDAFVVQEDNFCIVEILRNLQTNSKLMMDTRSKAAVLSHRLHLGALNKPIDTESFDKEIDSYCLRLLTAEGDDASISSANLAHTQRVSPIRDLARSLSQSLGTPSPRPSSLNKNQVSMIHPYITHTPNSGNRSVNESVVDGWNISGEMISPPGQPKKQHIMLSYSWHPSAKPHLVVQLQDELKHMGYDVWRDETGSLLVPPLAGCSMIEERLADAIEASDTIIICVSPMYKLSSNCRIEASYASVLARRHQRLKILFVMMDDEYTTVSRPAYCDGWLASMIGHSVWFPLFSEEMLSSTAVSLANNFSNTVHLILREQDSNTTMDRSGRSGRSPVAELLPISEFVGTSDSEVDDHMSALTEATSSHLQQPSQSTHQPLLHQRVPPESRIKSSFKRGTGTSSSAIPSSKSPGMTQAISKQHMSSALTANLSKRPTTSLPKSATASDMHKEISNISSKIPRGKVVGFAPSSVSKAANISNSTVKTSTSAHTEVPTTVSPTKGLPEDNVWEIINTPLMLKDETGLQAYLLEEGILHASDLRYCDEPMFTTISAFLKTIPKRKFLEAVKNLTLYQDS
jgi:DNA-directed RNA polymerase subunit F